MTTIWRELDGVALEIEQHLLQAHLVGCHFTSNVWESVVRGLNVDLLGLNFVMLNPHDLVDCLAQLKSLDILPEFALVDLRQSQQVANVKTKKL